MCHRPVGEPRLTGRLSGTGLGRIRKGDSVLSRARLTVATPRRGPLLPERKPTTSCLASV